VRCVCGYDRAEHDAVGKCPLCACGDPPAAHEPAADGKLGCACACGSPPLLHDGRRALYAGIPCPGRRSKTSGAWLLLRQGTFKPAEPEVARRDWFGLLVPVIETKGEPDDDEVRPHLPPRVPARPPYGPHEIAGAGGGKQGTKLGRGALALGWQVEALYWQAADGSEGCAVRLAKPPLRAVALWSRPAELAGQKTGWKAGAAYAWRTDVARFPTKVTHTDLERLIA
jgi:hypothetical protein